MNPNEPIQFQIDFSTADMERGSCLVPFIHTITIPSPSSTIVIESYLPETTELPSEKIKESEQIELS